MVFYYAVFLSPAYASDLSAPSLMSPSDGAVVNGMAYAQTWSAVPGAIRYEYQSYHDAAGLLKRWASVQPATSKPVTGVANATYWWRVRAINADGQASGWSPLWKLTVDNDKPAIHSPSFTQQPSSTSIPVTGAITEPNLDKITMKVDDVALDSSTIEVTGTSYTASLQNLAIGNHTLTITAIDKAGNSTTASYPFTVTDNTAPQIAITSPLEFNEGSDVVISGTAVDEHSAVANVTVVVDGNDHGSTVVTGGVFGYHAGALSIGTHTVTVRGSDTAGNQGISQPVTVTVRDVTPPQITLGDDIEITEGDIATIVGTINDDAIAEVTVRIDGVERSTIPVENGGFNCELPDLTAGTYMVEVIATDTAGNQGAASMHVRVAAPPAPEPTTDPKATPQPEPQPPASPTSHPNTPSPAETQREVARSTSKRQDVATRSSAVDRSTVANTTAAEERESTSTPDAAANRGVDGGTTDAAQEVKGSATDRPYGWGLTLWSWVIPLIIGVIGGWYLSAARHRRGRK